MMRSSLARRGCIAGGFTFLAIGILSAIGIGSGLSQGEPAADPVRPAERGIAFATAPDGVRFALSPAVDAGTLEFKSQGQGRYVYLADGKGPAAGMRCIVVARRAQTSTACDTASNVERIGLVVSGETGRGTLDVTGHLPGATPDASATGQVFLNGDGVFALEVPESQAELGLRRNGVATRVPVPGGGPTRLKP